VNAADAVQDTVVFFRSGSEYSTTFTIFTASITDFDRVDFRSSFTGNFRPIDGLSFRWWYVDPATMKYLTLSRALMALFMLYVLVRAELSGSFGVDIFTQVFCLLIAGVGALPFNPVFLLMPWWSPIGMVDYILFGSFVALFRMFIVVQIELVRSKQPRLPLPVLIVAGLFFACYSTVDAAVCYERALLLTEHDVERASLFKIESLLLNFHCVYAAAFILLSVLAFWSANGYAVKRLTILVLFGGAALAATIFVQVICVEKDLMMNTIVPSVVFTTAHTLLGAFTVFLMRTNRGRDYQSLDVGNAALDVEEASAGGEDEGFPENDA
jgi:hypothetical protein